MFQNFKVETDRARINAVEWQIWSIDQTIEKQVDLYISVGYKIMLDRIGERMNDLNDLNDQKNDLERDLV